MSLSQHFHMKGAGRFLRAPHRKGVPQIFYTGPPKPKATTDLGVTELGWNFKATLFQ